MAHSPPSARRIASASTEERLVLILALAALGLRLLVRRALVAIDPHQGGYDFYLSIARTFAQGGGLCESPGHACALRLPLYPLLLWPFATANGVSVGFTAVEAALGGALVYVTYRIGRELFNGPTGLLAAVAALLSPYALVHDTALQDTVLLNALVGTSVWLLLTLRRPAHWIRPVVAGTAVALALLTTARVALIVPCVIAWATLRAGTHWPARLRNAALITLPIAILLGGWVDRNARVVGAPVLTTESGQSLWVANNAWTMMYLPSQSIDLVVGASYASLSPLEHEALAGVGDDEVASDRMLGRWGLQFIAAHPLLTLRRSAIKMAVPLLAYLSPARGPLVDVAFAAVYLPVHALAVFAAWRVRSRWAAHLLPCMILAAFLITTGVYWAHTSHASYLDPLWFVYAAAAVTGAGSGTESEC